ncbi:hypothetical protein D3C87_1812370 [compost metagenome]
MKDMALREIFSGSNRKPLVDVKFVHGTYLLAILVISPAEHHIAHLSHAASDDKLLQAHRPGLGSLDLQPGEDALELG